MQLCNKLKMHSNVNSTPHRDKFTKEKIWNYTVRIRCKGGKEIDRDYMLPANDSQILVFPEVEEDPLPDTFPLAGSVEQSLGDQKRGILATESIEYVPKKLENVPKTSFGDIFELFAPTPESSRYI